MSRIPQSRTNTKTPSTPVKTPSRSTTPALQTKKSVPSLRQSTTTTPRVRTQSTSSRSATPSRPKGASAETPPPLPPPPVVASTPISIREAIALKRAEAKKAQSKVAVAVDQLAALEDAIPDAPKPEEDDLLGRLSVRDTIERARSTGSLNLATRSLPCLPSAIFEIHLNIKPDPLKSVPNEPVLPPSEPSTGRRGRNSEKTTWFEAQDLTVLKAWNNEIQEIQHEISLFGSLKTVDLHKNKLAVLPNAFADLTALTVLDLSHNALTAVPDNLFALPELTSLNLSYNQLSSLPFNAPFKDASRMRPNHQSSASFFAPVITRSTTPLPRLVILDASNNHISAAAIDNNNLPVSLTKVDLSNNPLGQAQQLFYNLASLKRLKQLRFAHAEIGDDSLPSSLPTNPFSSLRLLDMEESLIHLNAVKEALKPMYQELNFDFVNDEPPEGVTRVLVGKRVIKEAWEIELERRRNLGRVAATVEFTEDWAEPQPEKRSSSRADTSSPAPSLVVKTEPDIKKEIKEEVKPKPKVIEKETWEIEAEQGLMTEGGRRRARAAAAQAEKSKNIGPPKDASVTSSGLSNAQYFTESTQTLRLPASAAPSKSGHARAFSVAGPFPSTTSSRTEDLAIPTPTLPLSAIVGQPFASTLRILVLSNRRMDRSFALPSYPDDFTGFLPCLEELDLEGCNLNDVVPTLVSSGLNLGTISPPRSNESLIPTITKLFPSLRSLNLSYNTITNASLNREALSNLILASSQRNGLRHLRLRGNRISELDGFLKLAEAFKGNRQVPTWKLEELDVRDNEIGKLLPELGLLPLDVFLVDGNTFRVPQRRVWEREGTRGLLSWLRGRIE